MEGRCWLPWSLDALLKLGRSSDTNPQPVFEREKCCNAQRFCCAHFTRVVSVAGRAVRRTKNMLKLFSDSRIYLVTANSFFALQHASLPLCSPLTAANEHVTVAAASVILFGTDHLNCLHCGKKPRLIRQPWRPDLILMRACLPFSVYTDPS